MATVIKTREVKCPCCGAKVNANDLGRAGLTPELLEKLGKYIHEGTLEEMFAMGESLKRQMDPSATSIELVLQGGLAAGFAEMSKPLNQMSKAIAQIVGGTGKGEVAELLTTEVLRQFFPQDEFDGKTGPQGGSDIIAKISDRKTEVGKITISIKNTKTFRPEYKEQMEKNMEQDSTKIGILVSEKLPKRANETGEPIHNNGVLYFLVHPRYVTALYAGLRYVVIHMHETDQYITNKERELMQIGKISKALAQWISGDERKQFQLELDAVKQNAEQSIEGLQKIEVYNTREFKKVCDKQTGILRHVLNQESNLKGLKDLLNRTEEEEPEQEEGN